MTHQSVPAATRVLIVEDDPVFRLPLRATLASAGCTVIVILTGMGVAAGLIGAVPIFQDIMGPGLIARE